MSHPGLGVMIRALTGYGDSANVARTALGKTIAAIRLDEDENALHFEFTDGWKMKLRDEGQSCCEARYMRTDDDLREFIGAVLMDLEVREGPSTKDEYNEEHEVQFLVVTTSQGVFTLSNHNEHNGYYGGFSIEASEE